MALFTAGIAALTAIASSVGAAGTALAAGAAAGTGGLATGGLAAGGITALGGASGIAAGAGAGAGALGSISTALGVAGSAASVGGTVASTLQARDAAAAQRQAEALRARQMRLNATRERREIIRTAMVNRAIGLNAQAGSGAEVAGSSAYNGLLGGNTTASQNSILANRQNEDIGEGLFQANTASSRAESNSRTYSSAADFGGTVARNNLEIARIGTSLFSRT